jgi:hypothetical protein
MRAFLIKSERCLLSHGLKLLAKCNSPGEDRQRLEREAATAEEDMRHLVGRHEINISECIAAPQLLSPQICCAGRQIG